MTIRTEREPRLAKGRSAQMRAAARWRRRARAAVQVASARMAALATLSHEMREPLNGVVGMTRLLAETRLDPEQRSFLDSALEAAETLVTLVNDVLDLARIDAGAVGLVAVDFSLPHLLDSLQRMFEPRAALHSVRFVIETEPGLPEFVRGDPGRLRQVLVNLLGNAVKFTERGEVRLTVRSTGRRGGGLTLRCRVRDTGPGLEPAAFERLTMAFVQAEPGIGRLYGGSGLGLLIARRLLEAMGGGLDCLSDGAQGACLEATCEVEPAAPRSSAVPAPPSLLGRRSLLIIDARERTRSYWRNLTTLWGMDVRAVATVREGLVLLQEAAARTRPIDLVLVDGGLGDQSTQLLARRVQATPALRQARLVLLAPAGFRGDAARAHATGFAAYLPRTADADLVRACLQRLLGGRAAEELVTLHKLGEARPALQVLVVDDNPLNCRLASIMLERAGHAVATAESGQAAMGTLQARSFDVVLMDLQMPGMDGLETTRRIRALPATVSAAVPILAVTANAMQGDERRCLDAGMDGYLTKPIDGASLVAAVERLASTRQAA